MKLLSKVVSALALIVLSSSISIGGEWVSADNSEFFNPKDRATAHAHGLSSIQGRYPRVGDLDSINIPAGAMSPIPVDPFSINRPYSLGESAVKNYQVPDAKGRASYDVKGRAAWDGHSGRMVFGGY